MLLTAGSCAPCLRPRLLNLLFRQVEGDANDYVGKGLSGGKVVVYPKAEALEKGFVAEDNVIVGTWKLFSSFHLFVKGDGFVPPVGCWRRLDRP